MSSRILGPLEYRILKLEQLIEEEESGLLCLARDTNRVVHEILGIVKPRLVFIELQGENMPTPGPITLTSAGQTDQTVIEGLDQNGQPFTPIPQASYVSDNTAVVTVDSNGLVTAIADGKASVTASLTTAEGLALSSALEFIVSITVKAVLTTIQLLGQ